MGEATFEEPGVVVVDGERIRAPRVVVATGDTPAPPPIPGLEETPVPHEQRRARAARAAGAAAS